MIFLQERIGKLLEELQKLIYPQKLEIGAYRMIKTAERFEDITSLDTGGWDQLDHGGLWGGHREYYWFASEVVVPPEFDGKRVVFRLTTGREGEWDATNPQFMLYVNGKPLQGMDVNHTEALLSKSAKAGETFRIVLSAFTGDNNFSLLLKSFLCVLDCETENYYYDCKVPFDVACLLPDKANSSAYITIIKSLNESLNLLDLRVEYSPEYYASLKEAGAYLQREFYETYCGKSGEKIYCVGHTHIDVAWLWSLAVTKDKAVRTFTTMTGYLREYPELLFMSSQPQLYQFVKQAAPELYAEIKQFAAQNRWEPEGGMWLEADCNLSSGESLIRQFVHGQRFFREEFGVESEILWLPDVFGYSAALPQIMQKCGVKYFMTTKISWSEFNKIPYDTFQWEGIDGTRVLSHFIPSRDYGGLQPGRPSTEHEYYTTYNAYLAPSQVMGGWQRYQQKHLNDSALMSFGFGDGGGGPTRTELENQRRLAKGIPGAPQTVMTTAKAFFKKLEGEVSGSKYLPYWCGELYLEYHRGTYTSMARNKKYNRQAEFAYQNLELYSVCDARLAGGAYPAEEIRDGWETILLNQFHDILPGSSIKEVYDESREQYEDILARAAKASGNALARLTEQINAAAQSLVVFNPNGAAKRELVSFTCPDGFSAPVVYDGESALPTQKTEDGAYLFIAHDLPSKGYKTYTVKDGAASESALKADANRIENDFFSVELNDKGQFSSIFDKRARRELLKRGECGNVIMSYEDKPHNYDAWDLNNYYTEKSWPVDGLESAELIENGPVRACIRVKRKYLSSSITQDIYLYSEIARIDIRNEIDWKEKQIFLKTLFPVDVHASEATFEIQYGNVKRPTHANTSWDFAKFEVCAHKWIDLSEDDFGVSVLNDCKFGYSVRDGVIGLSMLKSALHPNPEADKEHHSFVYSIYPHTGGWRAADTVGEAYRLNNPSAAVFKQNTGGTLPAVYSFVTCDSSNVVIEVVKRAEESEDLILRLYECWGRRSETTLSFSETFSEISECDMLERGNTPIRHNGKSAELTVLPYEIKTIRLTPGERRCQPTT